VRWVSATRGGRGVTVDEERWGHKGVLRGCVPKVLEAKCLLNFLILLSGLHRPEAPAALARSRAPYRHDIADVVQKISHRVIRKLCHLGYLEAGLDTVVATSYDPLVDDAPELARTLAASVHQPAPPSRAIQ